MSANYVYILSESDTDDVFYSLCLEKIKGEEFRLISRRLRKGGGATHVRKVLRLLLKSIHYTGYVENTFFIIALDNDRSPIHPNHVQIENISKLPNSEQSKSCRFCELEGIVYEILGAERSNWPIKGAIAIPVQMLESWLLLIVNAVEYQNEEALPIFSRKSQTLAKRYYTPNEPVNQLKDLKHTEKTNLNINSNDEFILHCIEHLIPEALAVISPSFSLFKEQVDRW